MTPEQIESCWRDPHNRKWGLYFCKADPRLIVPKRFKWMGWTINAAHPSSLLVLLGMIALCLAPVLIVKNTGGDDASLIFTISASIILVCLLSAYLSSTKRWSR